MQCDPQLKPSHRIYMHFMLRDGWRLQFLEEDLKTPLPRKVTLTDPARIFEMAERGGYVMNLEGRQAIQQAVEVGRGGIWLMLTDAQYASLRQTARAGRLKQAG